MQTTFSEQDNAIFCRQQPFTKLLDFCAQNYVLYASLIFSVLCGINEILRAIDLLFDSNFFQSSLCDGKFTPFQLY